MLIGIVGKPNVGKSTFFAAATMAPVEIANYPFTTIDPNKGVGYVRSVCPCKELGVECNPNNSSCEDGVRWIHVELLDVAGLVPDAWDGKGLGNRFLDDLRQADALINVIDVSGSTDIEGNTVDLGSHDPVNDITFLQKEIDRWMLEIIKNGLSRIARQAKMQGTKPEAVLADRLAGLKVSEGQIKEAVRVVELSEDPLTWEDDALLSFCAKLREISRPVVVAMNKADISPENCITRVKEFTDTAIPTLAETELALKKAASAGLIDYSPGNESFSIKDGAQVNEAQRKALNFMEEKISMYGGTGVQECLEFATFNMLDQITVYPVEDESKFTDNFGKVLPDVFLMRRGSTARDLAFKVHTDLGEKFIRAVNAKTKRTVGADYILQEGDIIRIVADK